MSSFVRRLEKRMMKAAGLAKAKLPKLEVGLDGKPRHVGYRVAVIDKDGTEYGERWPRRIPPEFRQPANPKAKDLVARLRRQRIRTAAAAM